MFRFQSAKKAISKVFEGERWTEYERAVREWEQICSEMDQREAELRRSRTPGPCRLSVYFCGMVLCLAELPFRLAHHAMMWFIGSCLAGLARGEVELFVMQAAAHEIALHLYIHVVADAICLNLTHPCSPHIYVYEEDCSLQRPTKPVPPVDASGETNDGKGNDESCCSCCGCGCDDMCSCGLNAVCKAIGEAFDALLDQFRIVDENRLLRAAFCALSCHHSCHPAICCGPLCTEPEACCCCEKFTQRLARWRREEEAKKEARTRHFYEKTGRRYPGPVADPGQRATVLGTPQQLDMV